MRIRIFVLPPGPLHIVCGEYMLVAGCARSLSAIILCHLFLGFEKAGLCK